MSLQRGDTVLGRYVVDYLIGSGGMGQVYAATHATLGHRVAVKVLAYEADPVLRSRFEQEAQLMAKVRHNNVVSVIDYGTLDDGSPCIVMEFVDGVPLELQLEREGPQHWALATTAVLGVLGGLDAIHAASVVHRDLKPSNVILVGGSVEQPKLIDFGIAKSSSSIPSRGNITQAGVLIGTPAYMSPEQLVGMPVDHRADLYAAALIWCEMVTGRVPFETGEFSDLLRRVREPAPVPVAPPGMGEVPDAVSDVILAALSVDPADRPADGRAFAARLRTAMRVSIPGGLAGGGASEPPASPSSRPRRPTTRPPTGYSAPTATIPAPPMPTAGYRFLVAAVLPPSRLAVAAERQWLSERVGDLGRGFTLGAQVWMALQNGVGPEAQARRDGEALMADLAARYGPTVKSAMTLVDAAFTLTAAQLSGARPLPPALKDLLDPLIRG